MISMAGKAIRKWWALFALPTFAAFIIGFVVPFIMGVYLSFCKFTTVTDAEFVGLKNYTRALQDKEFLHALGFSTLLTIVTTIVINVVAFSIAYMLTKAIKGSNIFRSVFFMPNLIGGIILGYIWMLLLNGILAHWARSLTYSATYGFWGLVVLVCWQQIGYMMIIYIAGMQSLPTDVLEAASVDGANGSQTMFKIIIPLTLSGIISGIIMVFVPALTSFVISDLLGGGKVLLIGNVIEQEFMQGTNWNLGSGLSVVLMIFVVASMALMNIFDKDGGGTAVW